VNGSALERNLKLVLNALVENVNRRATIVHGMERMDIRCMALLSAGGDLNASTCRACASSA